MVRSYFINGFCIYILNTYYIIHICTNNILYIHMYIYFNTYYIYICLMYIHIFINLFLGKTVTASIQIINGKESIRHVDCHIAVREGIVRCEKCSAHRKTLQSTNSRLQQRSSLSKSAHSVTSPSSHANYRYLTTPERSLRKESI